jgi:hypothetical protein
MARPSRIWWRESKGCYYTTIDGKQRKLAKTLQESETKLQRLLRSPFTANATADSPTFAEVADRFLERSREQNEEETYQVHRFFLQSFLDHVKRRRVPDLCEDDLDTWCRKHAKGGGLVKAGGKKGGLRKGSPWSENTQTRARTIVLAALNFGTKKLNLPSHPLSHVRPGTSGRRECYLTPEQRDKVHQAVKGVFAEYVLAGVYKLSSLSSVTRCKSIACASCVV